MSCRELKICGFNNNGLILFQMDYTQYMHSLVMTDWFATGIITQKSKDKLSFIQLPFLIHQLTLAAILFGLNKLSGSIC